MNGLLLVVLCSLALAGAFGLQYQLARATRVVQRSLRLPESRRSSWLVLRDSEKPTTESENFDETTKKYGLEVGLFKAATTKNGGEVKPGDLLKKYGAAYLITSITFAAISYAICYFAISNGVDVSGLLSKVGIKATETASNVGTAGLAYAVHKAASPIRFPPTVALTPVVANWLGRKGDPEAGGGDAANK